MRTLEQELTKRIEIHKDQMITTALACFEEDGIYNSPLLRVYRLTTNLNGEEKAFKVAKHLKERAKRGEQKYYDKVYEMCWNRIKYLVPDTKAYNVNNEELQEY